MYVKRKHRFDSRSVFFCSGKNKHRSKGISLDFDKSHFGSIQTVLFSCLSHTVKPAELELQNRLFSGIKELYSGFLCFRMKTVECLL